jgi:hypothetical protein
MRAVWSRRVGRSVASAEDGFGLVLVIGIMGVVLVLIMVISGIATRSLTSSRTHSNFESALGATEEGIDVGLARVSKQYDLDGSRYTVPNTGTAIESPPVCSGAPVAAPTAGFASDTAERTWADAQITTLKNVSGCLVHTPAGDYATFIPSNRQTVYARGWSPSSSATSAKSRLLKAEYIFAPYRPANAVLTTGNLEIDSSSTVTTVSGQAPSLAKIHSNGAISVQGNPSVTGAVSSTGSSSGQSSSKFDGNPSGAVVQTPVQPVPVISAEQVYARQWANYATQWWDLCGNGTVHTPSASGPCNGPQVGNYSTGGTFNNLWSFSSSGGVPVWTQGGTGQTTAVSGVYFVDGANIDTGSGNPQADNMTVIAAATTSACAPKTGGDINWDRTNISAPVIPNLYMLADHDLTTGSNFKAGSASATGMFIAGDQINMQTSSTGVFGSVVAADQCASSGPSDVDVVKNPSITYDNTEQAPFTDVIDTTLWLEY